MNIVNYITRKSKQSRLIGLLLMVLGILSLLSPLAAGISSSIIIGILLLTSGVAILGLAFGAGATTSRLFLGLLGALGALIGAYMIFSPSVALAVLTILLAAYFVAQGVVEIIAAFQARSSNRWTWFLASGILSVLLGVIIWLQFPISGLWSVGVLLGIRLLTAGFLLFSIAGSVKQAIKEEM